MAMNIFLNPQARHNQSSGDDTFICSADKLISTISERQLKARLIILYPDPHFLCSPSKMAVASLNRHHQK